MIVRRFVLALSFALLLASFMVSLTAFPSTAFAQEGTAAQDTQKAKVQDLLKRLDDPDVRAWLESGPPTKPEVASASIAGQVSNWEGALRGHLAAMAQAFARLPGEMADAVRMLAAESGGRGFGSIALLLLGLAAIGYGAEWLARHLMRRSAATAGEAVPAEPSSDLAGRGVAGLVPVLAFIAASLGAFLAFNWPPLLRSVVLTYLVALFIVRIMGALVGLLSALLPPAGVAERNGSPRPVALDAGPVVFQRRRIVFFSAYLMAAWATVNLLPALGFSADSVQLLTYLAGIGLVAMVIELVWHAPTKTETPLHTIARKWLVPLFLVGLWVLWSVGLNVALWLGIYVLLLPKALSLSGQIAESIISRWRGHSTDVNIRDVLIVRGARASVILLAVLWLGVVLNINPGVLARADTTTSQIMRGLLRGVIILLVADLLWQFVKASITRALASDPDNDAIDAAEATRKGRLRTLLPIFRNALAVLIATIAGLMVLAEIGVEIGPLIAGAGIFGVAIGFGSQTLVKDIVSGIFYLMDDAFRVGEYIQSKSYKGTVESFSLRSVRLRHHRGPVFTVPFGELGAVQNMSRDWVIDKFMLRVPFDTDLRLVKKLTKVVGAELQADPDLGPYILQTVKMKGVEQFGDYGMEVSFAMMTKPGNQTSVRRRAYVMIRDSFAANGIDFAQPTVNVGGDDRTASAAAATAVTRQNAATAAAEG